MSPDYEDYALDYEDYFGEPPGSTTPDEAEEQFWEAEELERDYARARERRKQSNPPVHLSDTVISIITVFLILAIASPFALINYYSQMDYKGEVSAKRVTIQFDEDVAVDDYYAEFKVKNKTDEKIEHLTLKIKVHLFDEFHEIYFDEFSLEPKEEKILRTKSYKEIAQEINPYATGKDIESIKNYGIRDMTKEEKPTH